MRKVKFGRRQLLSCKDCGRKFAVRKLKNKTYGPRVITNAVSCYNLGNTLEESAKLTNRRFKVSVSKSSVHQWLSEFSGVCTYNKIRAQVMGKYMDEILFSKTFEHNGLSYNFRYHKPKLDILCGNGFSGLANYVKGFENGCPKYFNDIENRCSQMKVEIDVRKYGRFNNACRLAEFALKSCKNNRERHSVVENFMLVNDSSTIACEVPVWLWEKNLNAGINGHVDVLQVRNERVYVLDFKPEAAREKVEKVASQLFFYASGLSFRTGLGLRSSGAHGLMRRGILSLSLRGQRLSIRSQSGGLET